MPEEVTHISADEILEEMSIMSADLPLTRHSKDLSDSDEAEQEDNLVPESEDDEEVETPLSMVAKKLKLTPPTK